MLADSKADVRALKNAITRNTVVVIGSAPGFPHGVIDPIAEMSEIARQQGIGFHSDACLGGFILPWARELGYDVADFDFRLPGVTSISADTQKFGFAAKGTSVVLYRHRMVRRTLPLADGVRAIPELRFIGDPLFIISVDSNSLGIFQVLDRMGRKGWSLNGMHKPPASQP